MAEDQRGAAGAYADGHVDSSPVTPGLGRSYAAMTVANIAVFALTGIAYILYSRLLVPAEFALFGTALALSRICVTLLDGGVRNMLIVDSRTGEPERHAASTLVLLALASVLVGLATRCSR